MISPLYIAIGLIVLGIVWVIFTYNRFVLLRNRVREAWSDIEVQLKRRADLIPNLVATVKGYRDFEQETLQKVVDARSKALGAATVQERVKAEGELSQFLSRLLMLVENYPDLKASQNFLNLQEQLRETEDKIQYARRFYNSVVQEYNTALKVFPSNLIANLFGFKEEPFFDIPEEEYSEPPKVEL